MIDLISQFFNWVLSSWLHVAIVLIVLAVPLTLIGGYWTRNEPPGTRKHKFRLVLEDVSGPLVAVIAIPVASAALVVAMYALYAVPAWVLASVF
jgi:hypothetical protein